MACYPAGVTVIPTSDDAGNRYGLTVSAFTSVSIDPPLILIVIDKKSQTLPHLRENAAFAVNILSAGTGEVALGFAAPSEDKFVHIDEAELIPGHVGPILAGEAIAYLECRVSQEVEAGDHWIFVGTVEGGGVLSGEAPLIYCGRRFDTLASRVVQDAGDSPSK